MKYSVAGVGMYASLIVGLLSFIGIDADEGVVTETILAGAQIVSFAVWMWGQFQRKDLTLGILRK